MYYCVEFPRNMASVFKIRNPWLELLLQITMLSAINQRVCNILMPLTKAKNSIRRNCTHSLRQFNKISYLDFEEKN